MIHIARFVETIAAGLFLWLGLYVIIKDTSLAMRPAKIALQPSFIVGVAMLLTTIFLTGVVANSPPADIDEFEFWFKLTWWSFPAAVYLWLFSVVVLVSMDGASERRPLDTSAILLSCFFLLYALFCIVAGTFTDFIFHHYNVTSHAGFFQIAPSWPGLMFYAAYVLSALWLCVILLGVNYFSNKDPLHRSALRWLIYGGALMAIATTVRLLLFTTFPEQLADIIGTTGLVLIGTGIVRFSAFMQNRVFEADFLYSLTRALSLGIVYTLVVQVLQLTPGFATNNIGSVVFFHLGIVTSILLEHASQPIEYLFFPKWMVQWRKQLRLLEDNMLTVFDRGGALEEAQRNFIEEIQPYAQSSLMQEEISGEIKKIFRHGAFQRDNILAASRLHNLQVVQQGIASQHPSVEMQSNVASTQMKADILRNFLSRFIHQKFCPDPEIAPLEMPQTLPQSGIEKEWIEYLIFCEQYLHGKQRGEIMQFSAKSWNRPLSSAEYGRLILSGRKRLSNLLWQEEAKRLTKD